MFEELKRQLRADLKAKLAAISPDERRAKSASILARIVKRKAYKKATTVMAYASFGTEVETGKLLERILSDGKCLVLPRLNPFDQSLVTHLITDLEKDLAIHKLGFREPHPTCPVAALKSINWLLVPGLAFTEFGDRLGRGMGCYDRLIADISSKTAAVGLAFEEQIIGDLELPQDSHDMPVDLVITESRIIDPVDALDALDASLDDFTNPFS